MHAGAAVRASGVGAHGSARVDAMAWPHLFRTVDMDESWRLRLGAHWV